MQETGPLDVARSTIREVLEKYFRSEKRLNSCTNDMMDALHHMITVQPIKKRPKGATVMTESAASKREDGSYRTRPQNI